jgi:hypothetical protein
MGGVSLDFNSKVKVKFSPLQVLEALRVVREINILFSSTLTC